MMCIKLLPGFHSESEQPNQKRVKFANLPPILKRSENLVGNTESQNNGSKY